MGLGPARVCYSHRGKNRGKNILQYPQSWIILNIYCIQTKTKSWGSFNFSFSNQRLSIELLFYLYHVYCLIVIPFHRISSTVVGKP